ncbi:hypothetical protein U1Q18_052245 [Sarracenia purpurea var. burkii]
MSILFADKVYGFAKDRFETAEFKLVKASVLRRQMDIVNSHSGTKTAAREVDEARAASLPTQADLATFRLALDSKIDEYAEKRKNDFTYADYLNYCRHVICWVTMYNLRRSGEVATMSHDQFRN